MPKGFFDLVAIMDWHSRKVLSWRLSNTMDATFCVEALEEALAIHGRPEIFNSDQGAQFTSTAFTGVLERPPVSGSAWTAKAAAWIMFSSSACGAA
jgi:putative transposase